MKEEIGRWIKQAKEDFETAKANFEINKYKFSSYLCQQSVEKALKALLIKKTGNLIKIHDLVELGKRVKIQENFFKYLDRLTNVYLDARYPDMPEKNYTKKQTEKDLEIAEEILKWVGKNI